MSADLLPTPQMPSRWDGIKSQAPTRQDLHTIYQATMNSRIDFRGRLWATISAAATLSAGSAAAAGLIAARSSQSTAVFPLLGAMLVLEAVFVAGWTVKNVRREQRLLYHDEFTLFQIERLLGLHEVIPLEDRVLTTWKYLFESKHLIESVDSSQWNVPIDGWVEGRLGKQVFSNKTLIWLLSALVLPMAVVGVALLLIYFGA